MGERLPLGCILLMIWLTGCSRNEPAVNDPYYSLSGRVTDSVGNPLPFTRLMLTDSSFIAGDEQGNWSISGRYGSTLIEPFDSGCFFNPVCWYGKTGQSGIIFRGSAHSWNARRVYSWFCQMQRPNGLLENTENSNFVSLYDNALAALVFMAAGEKSRAEAIFDFFSSRLTSEFKQGKGGFVQVRDRTGIPVDNHRWMGDNAWLLIALNNYAERYGSARYQDLSLALENWIRSLQDTDGGIWGGFDSNDSLIGKVTEGMLDAFNAVPGYDSFHQDLLQYFRNTRWDAARQMLMAWPGNDQYAFALDVNAWSACVLENFPAAAVHNTGLFFVTLQASANQLPVKGFCFDSDRDDIWLEGTGEMILGLRQKGFNNEAAFYLRELEKMILPSATYPGSGGIPYVTNVATGYGNGSLWTGADTKPYVSSCAWYLFGIYRFNPFMAGYKKNIPAADKFWIP